MRILLQKSSKFRSFNYKSEEPGQMNLLNPNRNKMQSLIKTTDSNSKTEMLSSLTQNCVCMYVCMYVLNIIPIGNMIQKLFLLRVNANIKN